ncbi:eCIS core domain-containing protein [Spongorhabdus nitratireducens]
MYMKHQNHALESGAAQKRQADVIQKKDGLPNKLKNGIEQLSGIDMSHVKVHYNSSKPAQLNAHAYTQGSNIHVASGQEKHLAHEAWHVVQQAQGRVKNTNHENGTAVNDDPKLEKEADVMGARALQLKADLAPHQTRDKVALSRNSFNRIDSPVIQRKLGLEFETSSISVKPSSYKEVLATGDGFKVEGDNGNLEIVTDPFSANKEGKEKLVQSVTRSKSLISSLISGTEQTIKKDDIKHKFGQVNWKKNSKGVKLKKKKHPATAHPQVTMGIPLAKMLQMYEIISQDNPSIPTTNGENKNLPHFEMDQRKNKKTKNLKWDKMKTHMRQAIADVKHYIKEYKDVHKNTDDLDTSKLQGLLTQILISTNSASDADFQKNAEWNQHNVMKNQFVVLPKTKLHHLYKLMSRKERLIFVEWSKKAETKDKFSKIEILEGIPVNSWIENIYNPNSGTELASFDSQIEGLGSKQFETDDQNGAADRTLKAMTENLGSPTNIGDSKDDRNESGGIFEFRHLKASVPVNEWPDVAEEAMSLAIWLESTK